MHEVKMVVFDLDGTALDTPSTYLSRVREAGERCGFAFDEATENRAIKQWGAAFPSFFKDIFPGATHQQMLTMRDVFRELDAAEPPQFFPGCKETLEFLRKRRIICTMLTSRYCQPAIELLKRDRLHHHFRHIVGVDDLAHESHAKPDPRSMACTLRLMEELGIAQDEVILVGDTYADLHTGKNVGIRTIIVRTGSFKNEDPVDETFPFECIDSIADLPAHLFPADVLTTA